MTNPTRTSARRPAAAADRFDHLKSHPAYLAGVAAARRLTEGHLDPRPAASSAAVARAVLKSGALARAITATTRKPPSSAPAVRAAQALKSGAVARDVAARLRR